METEIKMNIDTEQNLIEQGYKKHHTASARGYISRKVDGIVTPYRGRFGVGYVVKTPRWDTTQYYYVTYYIKEDYKK